MALFLLEILLNALLLTELLLLNHNACLTFEITVYNQTALFDKSLSTL